MKGGRSLDLIFSDVLCYMVIIYVLVGAWCLFFVGGARKNARISI